MDARFLISGLASPSVRKMQTLTGPRRRYERPIENISVERSPTMRSRAGGRDSSAGDQPGSMVSPTGFVALRPRALDSKQRTDLCLLLLYRGPWRVDLFNLLAT